MKRMNRVGAIACAAIISLFPGACLAASKVIDGQTVMPAVIQAVEDEIYDLRHEDKYFLIDGNGGGDSTPATINIYISKDITNGVGIAVYKDMPYGEVYRYFTVDDNGLVTLSGGPTSFPPIGGSMLTIYMTEKDVSAFIQNAYNGTFSVDPNVSSARLKAAEKRQISRTQYSFRLKKGVGPYR